MVQCLKNRSLTGLAVKCAWAWVEASFCGRGPLQFDARGLFCPAKRSSVIYFPSRAYCKGSSLLPAKGVLVLGSLTADAPLRKEDRLTRPACTGDSLDSQVEQGGLRAGVVRSAAERQASLNSRVTVSVAEILPSILWD